MLSAAHYGRASMKASPQIAVPQIRLVRQKRMYEQLAEQIETLIRVGDFAPGARLPAERELAERVGVSRPSLREALIALETAGLIETRVGDGTYVRGDIPAGPVFPLSANQDLGPGALEQFEARRALECAAAELAAQRAGTDEIDALAECLARMTALVQSGGNPGVEHRSFHTGLADASHNGIIARAVRDLWRVRQGEMWNTLRRRIETPESFRAGLVFRTRLIAALRAGDRAAARAEMETHFDRVGRHYFDP